MENGLKIWEKERRKDIRMSVQSRIRKIEKKNGVYKRRKEDVIKCKPKIQEKELSLEEMAKRIGIDL